MTTHSNAFIEAVPDPAPDPAHKAAAFREELLEAGVHPDALEAAERVSLRFAFTVADDAIRYLLRSLGQSSGGRALERMLLGAGGRTFEQDAQEVGVRKQTLCVVEARMRKRLKIKNG